MKKTSRKSSIKIVHNKKKFQDQTRQIQKVKAVDKAKENVDSTQKVVKVVIVRKNQMMQTMLIILLNQWDPPKVCKL